MGTFLEYELNGKKICFHKDSKIEVQLGKNKSAYKTVFTYDAADFGKAVFTFNCYNVGRGYKKRLLCRSLNKPTLARVVT